MDRFLRDVKSGELRWLVHGWFGTVGVSSWASIAVPMRSRRWIVQMLVSFPPPSTAREAAAAAGKSTAAAPDTAPQYRDQNNHSNHRADDCRPSILRLVWGKNRYSRITHLHHVFCIQESQELRVCGASFTVLRALLMSRLQGVVAGMMNSLRKRKSSLKDRWNQSNEMS
jgi:hypothetical protein